MLEGGALVRGLGGGLGGGTSRCAGEMDFHSSEACLDMRLAPPFSFSPAVFSCRNMAHAVRVLPRVGGERASSRSSFVLAFSFSSARLAFALSFLSVAFSCAAACAAFCVSVKGFLARVFFGAAFFVVDFAAVFRAFTSFVAGSVPDVSFACRLAARLTGRDGSPTAFRGRPGVA